MEFEHQARDLENWKFANLVLSNVQVDTPSGNELADVQKIVEALNA